jgi:hypothetical protein
MEQHTNVPRSPKTSLDQIPDFVIAAAVKGIRSALRDIVHDRRKQRTSAISRLATPENQD